MTDKTVEVAPVERVNAFMAGVQATSLALMAVLKKKTAVGLLTEELARKIFADVGFYIAEAIEELPEEQADGPSA